MNANNINAQSGWLVCLSVCTVYRLV